MRVPLPHKNLFAMTACLILGLGMGATRYLGTAACSAQPKGDNVGHGYTRHAGHILFNGQRIDQAGRDDIRSFAKAVGHPLKLCEQVDAQSFIALSEEYSKDKTSAFYKWISPGRFWVVELESADPATFKVLDVNLAKDAKRVWYRDEHILGADPATAAVIHPHWTWKDHTRVYYHSKAIAGADPATFRHLEQGFYKDSKRVYWSDVPLAEADPATFQTFGNDVPYAKDRDHVWSGSTVLADVEAKSFQLLHNHVYKDAKRVYVGTEALEVLKADSASFVKVASLRSGAAVLFRDLANYYVYDRSYGEIYTLEPKAGELLVWKPVWLRDTNGSKPAHGATVFCELKNGALCEPHLKLLTPLANAERPTWEGEKLKRLESVFAEAQKQIGIR